MDKKHSVVFSKKFFFLKIKPPKNTDFYQTLTKINNTLSLKHAILYECNNGVHKSDLSHFLFAYLSSEQFWKNIEYHLV